MKPKQLNFSDFIDDFHKYIVVEKPILLQLFEQFIDINELISLDWHLNYNKRLGRNHNNSLTSIVSTLILQKLLSIPGPSLLVTFLSYSTELRDFCGLKSVPDPSFYSRFKQDYCDDIENFFHKIVDITEPICQEIAQALEKELGFNSAQLYIMDTTGIECYVKENNPKFFNALVKKLQHLNKDKPKEDIYKMAYNQMPKSASADPNVKLQYINGTFCYAHKAVVVSNALGVIRHLDLCDYQPDTNNTNLNSPEEAKLTWDGKLLIPTMDNFFNRHPDFNIWALTADSGFDHVPNYKYLFENRRILPVIALNPRNTKQNFGNPGFNEYGIPICPKDPSLPMKWDGTCKGKNRALRNKFICPKTTKLPGGKYICSCENKCTTSNCGRMFYIYPKNNYRVNTPIPRGTELWDKIADCRHIIEQVISRLKLPLQLGSIKARNRRTIKADLFMAGAAHLIIVLLAYRMGAIDKIRSVKSIA